MRALVLLLVGLSFLLSRPAQAQPQDPDFFAFDEPSAAPTAFVDTVAEASCSRVVLAAVDPADGFSCVSGRSITAFAAASDGWTQTMLPPLPDGATPHDLLTLGSSVYVSTTSRGSLLFLDSQGELPSWSPVDSAPEALAPSSSLVALGSIVYVISSEASFRFDPRLGEWKSITAPPPRIEGHLPFSSGSAHLLFISGSEPSDAITAYHTITDRWFQIGRLPSGVSAIAVGSAGTAFSVYTGEESLSGRAVLKANLFGPLDYVMLALLAGVLAFVGVKFSSKNKTSGDYYRAGKSIPWWAASLSIFATGASAITIMAMPAMSFGGNWIYVTIALYLITVQVPLFWFIYVPLVRRLDVSTANEYLERRYGLSVRLLGFVGFSLFQILGRMASILLLPAVAINSIFGIPIEYCILFMGICTTLFVTVGGLEAVIWTDVILALIVIVAVSVSLVLAVSSIELSPSESWALISAQDKLFMFDWRIDLAAPVVIVLFLNSFATSLQYIGDQNFVQRVQCTKTEKDAKWASISQLFVAVPLNFVLFALGTALFLYYSTRPEDLSPAMKPDGIYPFFAASVMPAGMAGFVVVALLAGTISTVSSALNSVSNLGVEDIYRRFKSGTSDREALAVGRIITIGLGMFGTSVALLLAQGSGLQSIWDLFLMIAGIVIGPVTAVFLLGLLSSRVNTFGAWVGAITASVANISANLFLELHSTVFLTLGVVVCLVVGYAASYLAPRPKKSLDGLMITTLIDPAKRKGDGTPEVA